MGTALCGQPRLIHYAPRVSRCIDSCQFLLAVRAANGRPGSGYRHGDSSPCRYRGDLPRERMNAVRVCSLESGWVVRTRPCPRRNPFWWSHPRPPGRRRSQPGRDRRRCPCRTRLAGRSRSQPARHLASQPHQGPDALRPAARSSQPAHWGRRWLCPGPTWSRSLAGRSRSWLARALPQFSCVEPSPEVAAVGRMRR